MSAVRTAEPSEPKARRVFGRFELRQKLGEGGQAVVWLGFDQRLQREVAVKLMRSDAAADPLAVGEWLREARSVSRLTHPNIVPVFEADVHDSQAYLVYEYVKGPTLAQLVKSRGALPVHEAVALMLGVLDALHEAHTAGVVHRDLKPSNVLVSEAGRARVMDFGIAAHVHDARGNDERTVGTPGYMSPEATRGEAATGAMDVFSVGLMLVEVLAGQRLITERDPQRAMHRVAHEDLALPASLSSAVDDALRIVLRRALERDPARRYATAADFRDALRAWLKPDPIDAESGVTPPRTGKDNGTLDFLLRRMRHKADFPALSDSVARIQRIANSDNDSLQNLTSEILQDVALTNKLLRLVNTASFSSAAGSISTVSRAITMVGFAGIRNLAMSLVLLENMHDKTHANQLKEEFLRSLLAGMVASELGMNSVEAEEAFIGAMFQNLGRLLTEYYFPEEASQVRGLMADKPDSGAAPITEVAASVRVLGVSFEQLGIGVANVWSLPAGLQNCMRKPATEVPTRASREPAERLRWLTLAANQIADTLLVSEPDKADAKIAAIAHRYSRSLSLEATVIESAAAVARTKLAQMVTSMNMQVAPSSVARRLFTAPIAVAGDAAHDATLPATAPLTAPPAVTATLKLVKPGSAVEILAEGIQAITDMMVEDSRLNEVLRAIVDTIHRALRFQRVVFCLRDLKTDSMTGRFGVGDGADAVSAAFRAPLKLHNDLFAAVCTKGADIMIADAKVAHIASRLPDWYRKTVDAPAFLLLPAMKNGAPFALIYADTATAHTVTIGEREFSLLRTLRNQALMAFKQAT